MFALGVFTKVISHTTQFTESTELLKVHLGHSIPELVRLTDGRPRLRPHAPQILVPRAFRNVQDSQLNSKILQLLKC